MVCYVLNKQGEHAVGWDEVSIADVRRYRQMIYPRDAGLARENEDVIRQFRAQRDKLQDRLLWPTFGRQNNELEILARSHAAGCEGQADHVVNRPGSYTVL